VTRGGRRTCCPMVKMGFLGCGFVGQGVHLRNFLATGRCQVVALAEARPRLAAAVAQRHGIPRVYSNEKELALDPEVEAVAAITSEVLHPQTVPPLLEAGKHVFIEKPISTSSAVAERIAATAKTHGALLMVAYMKRCDPGVLRAKEIISGLVSDGSLGAPTLATLINLGGDWIAGYEPDIIKSDEPAPGAKPDMPEWLPQKLGEPFRVFNNVYCHDVDVLRFLLDAREWSVEAARHDGRIWSVQMKLGGLPVTLNAGGWSGPWYEQLAIHFEKGRVEVVLPAPLDQQRAARVRVVRGSGEEQSFDDRLGYRGWAFYREAEHFLECVEQGKQPVSSGADAVVDLQIVEEIFRRLAG
jgi:predicted dehydrogenase